MNRGVGRVGGGTTPQEWFNSLPPITRTLLVAAFATTAASSFGIVSPFSLALIWPRIVHKFEIWRLVGNFVFLGPFSFPFLLQLFLLVQYASRYEASPFDTGAGGTSADFFWMLVVGCTLLLAAAYCLQLPFMSHPMSFMILYVWTRKNPDADTSIFSFQFKAFYLPWAILALNLLIGNDIYLPLIGLAAGHLYYFLHYIAPTEYGVDLIQTPSFVMELFGVTAVSSSRGRPPVGRPTAVPSGPSAPRQPYARHNWGPGNVLGEQ